jgi:predicted deacylase
MSTLTIHKTAVEAGAQAVVKIPVGRLPSGNLIRIEAHVFRSDKEGPVALVMAGVHGDEINGVEIVRRAIVSGLFERLECGSIIAIPLVNIYGFINFSREVPDGKDVNRAFPGSMKGSLASRVARTLTKKILPHIDFTIDYHTGGASLHNYPQIRYSKGHEASRVMALQFGAPLVLAKSPISKSFRKVALEQNKPTLVFEGGESLRYDGVAIEKGLAGLQRLLAAQQMLKPQGHWPKADTSIHLVKSTWVRAPRAGLFLWHKDAGHYINKGEILGEVNDPHGTASVSVQASRDGYIIGHNNAAVVNQGDALFHIGYE